MLKAVFFDQDGVIADTERQGHRVAFNRAFAEAGLDVEWDVALYHRLLQVGGGRERLRHFAETTGLGRPAADTAELVDRLHARKTRIFVQMVENGELAPRPGVHRLMKEIEAAGLTLAVCTTSNERSAAAIRRTLLPDVRFDFVLTDDLVDRKKPDPAIYVLACRQAGVPPHECLAVEDSAIGLRAARGAGLRTIVTVTEYTRAEDTSAADLVVTCLGDPDGGRARVLRGDARLAPDGVVRLAPLLDWYAGRLP